MEEDEDKEDQATMGAKVRSEDGKGGKRGSIDHPKFETSITLKRQGADADRWGLHGGTRDRRRKRGQKGRAVE